MPDTTPVEQSTLKPQSAQQRPVLVWHPGRDEPIILPNVAEAAGLLGATVEGVIAAIERGDLIEGRFVDWAAPSQVRAS